MIDVKYKDLVVTLTREILGGKFEPLGSFPSERALAKRFGVSRQTARRVMRELSVKGLIYSRQGRGTKLTRVGVNLRESVGLILTGERRTEIVREIREEVTRLSGRMGLELVFGDASALGAGETSRKAMRLAKEFAAAKVSGVILQPVEFAADAEAVNARIAEMFDKAGISLVLIDCDIVAEPNRSAYDVVGIDNFQAGRLIGRHLADNGATGVVFLAQRHYPPSVAERMRGLASQFPGLDKCRAVVLRELSSRSIARAFAEFPKPEAVVCQNDIAAVKALAAFHRRGWRVPEDVLVAGFDDVAYAPIAKPSLTSVRQPCARIARRAFDLLVSRIGRQASVTESVSIVPELIVRESTALR